MKNTSSTDKLSSTDGKTDFASRVKNLLSNSPLVKRKRSMSLPQSSVTQVFGTRLDTLVARDGGEIPFIIRRVAEYIEENGMDSEGLYRVNGNAKNIEKMRLSFDKVGDANFEGEDIPAVAGLLKLFLRQLPEGVVPNEKVREFVHVQQSHPHKPTPKALSELRHAIHTLPPSHYATLKYLIRHLSKVAEHTDKNKMTAVSLSIVFGPNLFHCGEGLEALQLQGYSNSTVCRMVLYHEVLFEGVEEVKVRKRSSPARPRPYSEHMAEKRIKREGSLSPIRSSVIDSTSDLERSYSEKSIDEAILERNSGALSPTSPTHLQEPTSPKTPPPRPPPPKFKKSPSKEVAPAVSSSNENKQGTVDEGSPFHRQYAKRGMKFNPNSPLRGQSSEDAEVKVHSRVRSQSLPSSSSSASKKASDGEVLKHTQVNMLSSNEDERMLQAPSPGSFMSSPGRSEPTSPAITPRSSRVVSSMIDQSINQYLFQPPPPDSTQSTSSAQHSQTKAPKADVYGLLLPEKTDQNSTHTPPHKPPPVLKRHSLPDGKKLRHRTSALFGDSSSQESQEGPMEDIDVQILSVSPERRAGGVESRQGRLSELISQFEEDVDGVGGDGGGGGDGVGGETGDGGKRKPSNKAFEMFEKKGLMIGMAGSSVPKVSFASTNTTISPSPSPSTSPAHQISPSHLQARSILSSEELSTKLLSTSTTGDEDVFSSPTHLTTHTPSTRGTLSTTASDDVFVSPAHTSGRGHTTMNGSSNNQDLDDVKREQLLDHAVLSRPKGPVNRRLPSRSVTTPTSTAAEALNKDSTTVHETNQSDRSKEGTSKRILSPVSESSSIAPEDQVRVEEGWCEGVGGVEEVDSVDTPTPDQAHQQKELARKIHVLKKQVKEFETQFVSSHGHKPAGEEKAPVRHLIEEVHRRKKQLKSIGGSPRHEQQDKQLASPRRGSQTLDTRDLSPTDGTPTTQPVTIHIDTEAADTIPVNSNTIVKPTTEAVLVSTKPLRRATTDSKVEREMGAQTKDELKTDPLLRRTKSEGEVLASSQQSVEQSRLTGTLNKLMGGLQTRRKSSARPDDLTMMSDEQLLQEKRDLQKALLQFEKAHGRPTNREDKETMRPLYDRYRLVKKLASTSGEPRVKGSQTLSHLSVGGLESTTDSLPSVTMLYSTTLGPSLPAPPEHKSVLSLSTTSHEASTQESSASLKLREPPVMSDSQLKKATQDKLLEQNKLLLEVKKDIRTKLKEFEKRFQTENGRSVEREDRGQMRNEYDQYKDVKTKLKIVAAQLAKSNPLKTI